MPNPKGVNQFSKGHGAPKVTKVSDRGGNPSVTVGRVAKPKTAVGGGKLNSKGFRTAPISKAALKKNDAAKARGYNPGSTR